MGFGNAAAGFMTGFMQGYKFIDDIQTKKAERDAATAKAEQDLAIAQNTLVEKATKESNALLDSTTKKNEAEKKIWETYDDALTVSVKLNELDSKYNDVETKTRDYLINTNTTLQKIKSSMQFEVPAATTKSQYVVVNGAPDEKGVVKTYMIDTSNPSLSGLDAKIKNNEAKINPDGEIAFLQAGSENTVWEGTGKKLDSFDTMRTKSVEKSPDKLSSEELTIQSLARSLALKPENKDLSQDDLRKKAFAEYTKLKREEKQTELTPFPVENITPDLVALLEKSNIKPNAMTGKYDNLTYGDIKKVKDVQISTSTFEPKFLYKNGKEISVTTKTDLDRYLADNWTTKQPEQITTAKINISQYNQAVAQGYKGTYTEWEATQKAKGESSVVVTAMQEGEKLVSGQQVDNAPKKQREAMTKLSPDQIKEITTFEQKADSLKLLNVQLTQLDKLIKSGKYNSNILVNFANSMAKVSPEEFMSIFGNKKVLMETYKMDASLASSVMQIQKSISGLAVTDAERKSLQETILGGINANPAVRQNVFQSYIDTQSQALDIAAENLATNYGAVNTAQKWINYRKMNKANPDNQGTKKTYTPPQDMTNANTRAYFQQYGFGTFTRNINGKTVEFMIDPNTYQFVKPTKKDKGR